MLFKTPDGMHDMLPEEAAYWIGFEHEARQTFADYGYCPVQTPMIERTDLFVRGIGEATDVVGKEMYRVLSDANLENLLKGEQLKDSSRLSLRPEGTAGVVRCVVEHNLVPQGAPPVKLMYSGPMFRAERPQKGRYRQFYQIGVECLGSDAPTIDAEAIIMLVRFFEHVGFPKDDILLLINSMGDDACRPAFREMLRNYEEQHADEFCDSCRERIHTNPLRAFDCKNEGCRAIMAGAPKIREHLCEDCTSHYERVKELLDLAGIRYREDDALVRGLDYYTRTVFEIQLGEGSNAIGGGGRYDKLAQEISGSNKESDLIPGFGFALGFERCKEALLERGIVTLAGKSIDLFVACATPDARIAVFEIAQRCRDAMIDCEIDHQDRSLKSQFKLADKLNAKFVAVVGDEELAQNSITLRNMETHEERLVPLDELETTLDEILLALPDASTTA